MSPSEASGKVVRYWQAVGGHMEVGDDGGWMRYDDHARIVAESRGVTLGVGTGDGALFVHGDYESIKAAQSWIDRARAAERRCEELEGDAARYRFLRESVSADAFIACWFRGERYDIRQMTGSIADAAIDAALAARQASAKGGVE